jgi:hypothetical protein
MRLRPPSIPAVIFVVLALFVAFGLQQPLLNSDGDTARHLRHGLYMLEHHQLISHDPFSFTRAGAPFLGFEYGSQLLFALADRAGGLASLVVLAAGLIALTYALLAQLLLRLGVDPLLTYLMTLGAAALGAGHWVARPHLFSFLGVVILIGLLERPHPAPAWIFAPFFAVWANLHGGFLFGWMLIAASATGAVLEWFVSRPEPRWRLRARYLTAALICAVLGTVANPHGIELHRHVLGFFGKHFIMDNTAEFVSPDFHEIDGRIFLLGILLALTILALHRQRPDFPRLLVIAMTIAFGLIAVRNMALFGLTALPLLALHYDDAWRSLPDPRGIRERFGRTAASGTTVPWAAPVVVALGLLAASRGRVGSVQLLADRFDSSVFPAAAVNRARSAGLQGRLFSEFAWGGYLLYEWPEQRIFIDGGTDFFGEDLFRDYSRIKTAAPGWRRRLEHWDIGLMLLRPTSSLAHEATRDSRWRPWYCDSVAVLFRRAGPPDAWGAAAADSAEAALQQCSANAGEGDSAGTRNNDE